MADPRLALIGRRLSGVENIVAVTSGKGGVGKSVLASTLSLKLRERGRSVGLLDLDFTSPSTHTILGARGLQPEEDRGIIPPRLHGLSYMSVTFYSSERPVLLRGFDVSNAIIELLAITRWGELDYLIIDMPPGIGDETMDLLRLVKDASSLLVSTPSILALETVKKLLSLLLGLRATIIGVVENMAPHPSKRFKEELEALGVPYLRAIGHDPGLEEALGDVERMMRTRFAMEVGMLAEEVEKRLNRG